MYSVDRKHRKVTKMFKKEDTTKTKKSYSKTRSEHYKDIVIAVLLTGIVAFAAGSVVQGKQQAVVINAVQSLTPTVSAEAEQAIQQPADTTELK